MKFEIQKDKNTLKLILDRFRREKQTWLSLFASTKINFNNLSVVDIKGTMPEAAASQEKLSFTPIENKGWKITCGGKSNWRNWWVIFSPRALIFPTREGEFISNPKKLIRHRSYSLSYPGSASTKCLIVFTNEQGGFLVGSKPSLNWARLTLTRNSEERFIFRLLQEENELYLIPFSRGWESALRQFRLLVFARQKRKMAHEVLTKPHFFLQMGVKDFFGHTTLHHFSDLLPFVKLFREAVGKGHFIHLFGTNTAGFDRMLPDFSVDPELGGKRGLSKLLEKIHDFGLYTSHHFNPRIAEVNWVDQHQEYKKAIVINSEGMPWIEFYKNNIYFVMNPNHKKWRNYCLKTIQYFKRIGFDYLELDQIAYQRNLLTREGGFGPGYQKLINEATRVDIKFWVEGVSDIYQLPPDCYFQVLPRDRAEFWETDENRRGYPYGTPFTHFYRILMPEIPISFQLVTQRGKVELIHKRLDLAKKLRAKIYDLELGFVDRTYPERLRKTLKEIKKNL